MDFSKLKNELSNGECVPYFGIGVYEGVSYKDGSPLPHDNDSMILALNEGRAMPPRLMYEFSRAAMSLEQKKGRSYIEAKVKEIYSKEFDTPSAYKTTLSLKPPYIISTNRDDKLLALLEGITHFVVVGKARLGAEHDRFEVYEYDTAHKKYFQVEKEALSPSKPTIFMPMGALHPGGSFIISDADYVDWLTEAMGGFAVPPALKEYRAGKKYLFLGVRFHRDTDRMAANEIMGEGHGGGYYVFDGELSKSEKKFLDKHNIAQIKCSLEQLLKGLS